MTTKENKIKLGDRVYYRYRIGFSIRTFSGKVTQIEGETVTVRNVFGGLKEVNINQLNKNKKQF